jgi:hypothetical protein
MESQITLITGALTSIVRSTAPEDGVRGARLIISNHSSETDEALPAEPRAAC